jgi:hypothetical protein
MEKQGRYKKQRIEFFLANFIAGKIAGDVTIRGKATIARSSAVSDRPAGGVRPYIQEL